MVESSAAAEVDAPQEEDSKEEEVRAEVSCRYFLSALYTVFFIINYIRKATSVEQFRPVLPYTNTATSRGSVGSICDTAGCQTYLFNCVSLHQVTSQW